jgi:outer membrane cobalamin receptor
MTLIVDGNIMPDSHLNDLNANDIYSIEVLRSGGLLAIYGSNAGKGALVITTKRGGETYEDDKFMTSTAPSGIITYPFKGYHVTKVFYSPKYTHQLTANELPDLRNTIYWNPNIITDKDGHASF